VRTSLGRLASRVVQGVTTATASYSNELTGGADPHNEKENTTMHDASHRHRDTATLLHHALRDIVAKLAGAFSRSRCHRSI
jgi:hypothetical protein